MGLDQGLDVRETVAFREAADGELLGVARGDGGGGVVGDVGVDLEGFVGVVLFAEDALGFGGGDLGGHDGGGGGGISGGCGEAAEVAEGETRCSHFGEESDEMGGEREGTNGEALGFKVFLQIF